MCEFLSYLENHPDTLASVLKEHTLTMRIQEIKRKVDAIR